MAAAEPIHLASVPGVAVSTPPAAPGADLDVSGEVVGIIGGSGLLKTQLPEFTALKKQTVATEHGEVVVQVGKLPSGATLAFVQRHDARTDGAYTQPADINYQGVALALKSLGVSKVVGVCSVGSLKRELLLGSVLVPADFYCPWDLRRVYTDARAHYMPTMHAGMRNLLLNTLSSLDLSPIDGGVYVNAAGPRFETKAEIAMMAQAGNMVGMTAAHEATACGEVGLAYAAVAIVDNFCNGIGPDFDLKDFHAAQAANLAKVEAIAGALLTALPITKLVDLVVHAKYIVPVEPHNTVYEGHCLVVKGGKIVALEKSGAARVLYAAAEVRDLEHHVLMPGMINAHTHLAMNHMRGLADDKPLEAWLMEDVWPTEGRLVSPDFVRDGTLQAAAECIQSGVTCVNDMYFFPRSIVDALAEAGIRASVGLTVLEFPNNYSKGAADAFAQGESVLTDMVDGSGGHAAPATDSTGLINFTWAPHAPYTVTDETFEKLRDLAAERGMKVHVHLHEATAEVTSSAAGEGLNCHLSKEKCRPFANLNRMGLVNERLIAVHMTQLTDEEISVAAASGVSVVHCPSSNLKLASGFCPVAKLLAAGVNVAIGTDSSASNNKLDMLAELRLAALLAKGVASDATVAPAPLAIQMATLNGAKALGLGDVTGSLLPGKDADFIAIRVDGLDVAPVYNIISHIVYVMDRAEVSDVWVRGRTLMKERTLTTLSEYDVKAKSAEWSHKVSADAVTDPGTPATPFFVKG